MGLLFDRGGWLRSDPCIKVDTLPDIPVGPSVDDFANALADHPLIDATTPTSVSLGGYSGKYIDLQLPSEITCTFAYYPWEPAMPAQGPSHRWHLWILDVEGIRVVVQTADFAGTTASDLAELQAIVDSIQIELPGPKRCAKDAFVTPWAGGRRHRASPPARGSRASDAPRRDRAPRRPRRRPG